jgi:two-component sensor histidine kinase
MNNSVNPTNWEEKAGALFGKAMANQGITRPILNLDKLLEDSKNMHDFIQSLLNQQLEELEAEVEKLKPEMKPDGVIQVDDVKNAVPEINGRIKAIDQVLDIIRSKK